jgi:hypothetical protein
MSLKSSPPAFIPGSAGVDDRIDRKTANLAKLLFLPTLPMAYKGLLVPLLQHSFRSDTPFFVVFTHSFFELL